VFRVGEAPLTAADADTSRLVNPRFHGTDRNDRPYVLSAAMASQLPNTTNRFHLDHPKADMTLESGQWIALSANKGHYDKSVERLDLAGGVSLFHDSGYAFRTESATIDLRGGTASGDVSITGQGPTGTIEGSGFRISEKGDRILFTGRSRVVIYGGER
jgi:lipopolysaccharide export system protein LptC